MMRCRVRCNGDDVGPGQEQPEQGQASGNRAEPTHPLMVCRARPRAQASDPVRSQALVAFVIVIPLSGALSYQGMGDLSPSDQLRKRQNSQISRRSPSSGPQYGRGAANVLRSGHSPGAEAGSPMKAVEIWLARKLRNKPTVGPDLDPEAGGRHHENHSSDRTNRSDRHCVRLILGGSPGPRRAAKSRRPESRPGAPRGRHVRPAGRQSSRPGWAEPESGPRARGLFGSAARQPGESRRVFRRSRR